MYSKHGAQRRARDKMYTGRNFLKRQTRAVQTNKQTAQRARRTHAHETDTDANEIDNRQITRRSKATR
eukprot:3772816-Prymnesium_polylepis.1